MYIQVSAEETGDAESDGEEDVSWRMMGASCGDVKNKKF